MNISENGNMYNHNEEALNNAGVARKQSFLSMNVVNVDGNVETFVKLYRFFISRFKIRPSKACKEILSVILVLFVDGGVDFTGNNTLLPNSRKNSHQDILVTFNSASDFIT